MPRVSDTDALDYYELAKLSESDAVGAHERGDWRAEEEHMARARTQALVSIAGALIEIAKETRR